MRTRYKVLTLIIILISPILVFWILWEYPEWRKPRGPEYQRIAAYSESQKPIFEQNLLKEMASKTRIHVRSLVNFDWDTVCVVGGYTHLREDLSQKNFYGKDVPDLQGFPNVKEQETAFVFLKKDRLVAVITHSAPDLRYTFDICTAPNKAILKLIAPNAVVPFEVQKANNYTVRPTDIKKYENCIGRQCELTFYGD